MICKPFRSPAIIDRIIAEVEADMNVPFTDMSPSYCKRVQEHRVKAARCAAVITMRRFGVSYADITRLFNVASGSFVLATISKSSQYDDEFPGEMTTDQYAIELASRLAAEEIAA